MATYPRMASLKRFADFSDRLRELDLQLPADEQLLAGDASPLARSISVDGLEIGNRFCILPMEGWDGTRDGKPTELTRRRWRNFGISGAKLMWGGEAVAIRHDGRANPNQLCLTESNLADIESLKDDLIQSHRERFGTTDGLVVGLQLTHSGRYAKPDDKHTGRPRTVQRNPVLDRRVGVADDAAILSDDDLKQLIDDFVVAASRAEALGFQFVDIKHCHGYLGHELLSGVDRPGPFGGSFENRTRFLRDIVAGIRAVAPRLRMGVRLSIFDFVPFMRSESGVGCPDPDGDPRLHFGCTPGGLGIDLSEPIQFVELLQQLGIRLLCTTAGSPYSTPHLQRPAFFPPSDGYDPPEEPLVGVERQVMATAELKRRFPNMVVVGSGYTYLQDWLPHVAQAGVAQGVTDSVGLGRMVLS